jgi:hypothetical protein
MRWLQKRRGSLFVILLRKLTEGETDPVTNKLMSKRSTDTAKEECPTHMLQYAFMPLFKEISNVI